MHIGASYELAASLVKSIIKPSNHTGEGEEEHLSLDYDPDRTHPVYSVDVEGPTLADTHRILDRLYHAKNYLDRYKPDDYRIGSVNRLQADINQFARLFVYDFNLDDFERCELVSKEELEKALVVSMAHSGISDIEFYYLYLYAHKHKFSHEAWSRLSGSGGLAEDDPELAEKVLGEALKIQQRALSYSGAFTQWTHSFRKTVGTSWLFERFLRQVNGPEAVGKECKLPYFYAKYSPSMPKYKDRGLTIHDFPGPGLVIYGIHSPPFPPNYLDKRYTDIFMVGGTAEEVDAKYRQAAVNGEMSLNRTKFAFFRGLVLIYNEEKMRVNGKPYGLLIFNDHFPNDHLETSYLVHGEFIQKFLKDPYLAVGRGNIFHPELLERRPELKGKLIKLLSVAATAGLCEEVPGYDTEIGVENRLRLHEEVRDASVFGFTQLDLIREAYRLYLLGYHYNQQRDKFYLDEFVMLKELLRINKLASQREGDIPDLPVAFPFSFFDHSVEDAMVGEVGFVGANMVFYKNRPKGDCMLFPGTINSIRSEELESITGERIRELIGGELEYGMWADFREGCEYFPANPLIVDPVYKRIGSNIIASTKK